MLKRLTSTCLALFCVLTFATARVCAATTPVTDAREGVVRIIGEREDGSFYHSGSGFAIGIPGEKIDTFITNNHVVEGAFKVHVVLDYFGEGGTYPEAEIIKQWQHPDLAIISLKTPINTWRPLPLMAAENAEVAQEVYALGFPGYADGVDDQGDRVPSTKDDVTVTKGIISKVTLVSNNTNCFQTDATIHKGNSGGPLITEDGYVIGVNSFGYMKDNVTMGINGAIHINYVMDALDNLQIPYEKRTSEGLPNGSTSSAVSEEPILPATTPDIPVVPSTTNFPVIPLVAGGIVVLIFVAIFLIRRKKKPNTTPLPSPLLVPPTEFIRPRELTVAPTMSGAKTLRIVGQSGHFAQDSFPVKDVLVMGRDAAKSNVVFPMAAPGVSAVHCELRREGNALIITDSGSSYGTFLADKTKLEQGRSYRLEIGDEFYLGTPENSFRVSL